MRCKRTRELEHLPCNGRKVIARLILAHSILILLHSAGSQANVNKDVKRRSVSNSNYWYLHDLGMDGRRNGRVGEKKKGPVVGRYLQNVLVHLSADLSMLLQNMAVPPAAEWHIDSPEFNDFSLDNDQMVLAAVRIFQETGLIKTFKIDYEVQTNTHTYTHK